MVRVPSLIAVVVALGALPAGAAASAPDASALRAAGVTVVWPALAPTGMVLPGDVLTVDVRSRRLRVRVALIRATRTGKPMRVVAELRTRHGRFRAPVPVQAGAHYLLVLDAGSYRYSTLVRVPPPPCPAGGRADGFMRLDRTIARRGDVLRVEVVNTGTTCLVGGMRYWYERWREEGWWERVETGPKAWPAVPFLIVPGTAMSHGAVVFEELQPGRHRLVKPFETPSGPVAPAVELDVIE